MDAHSFFQQPLQMEVLFRERFVRSFWEDFVHEAYIGNYIGVSFEVATEFTQLHALGIWNHELCWIPN